MATMMRSKAVLRSVAQELYDCYEFVDYFPSYDIISSIPFGRGAFGDNIRTVKPEVVQFIMSRFLGAHGFVLAAPGPAGGGQKHSSGLRADHSEENCDEALLEAYAKRKNRFCLAAAATTL